MAFKDRATPIIELMPTVSAFVALAMGLVGVKATSVDRSGCTFRAVYSIRPAQITNHRKTFCIINEVLDI
jgi:hypothetical protein